MMSDNDSQDAQDLPPPRRGPGLSFKLLLLTILFVMVAEICIYVPSIANFRLNWLNDRLAAARTAALVLDAAPKGMVPDELARQILDSIGAKAVAMKKGNQRRLLAIANQVPPVSDEYDLRDTGAWESIVDAFDILFDMSSMTIRVVGNSPSGGGFIEIVLDEPPLRDAMLRFSINILLLSLLISAITAALVYVSLLYFFVRPMRHITANMVAFRADPENPARIIRASDRGDELGTAARELAGMQTDIASMLAQKSRLAALGLAVSKINHDLRNLLSSAQLFSDQLATLPDERVQRFAPKLMRALERAIAYCQTTLSYGRAQEAAPDRRVVALEPLLNEVRETLGLSEASPIRWVVSVARGLTVDADPDQLFRILVNLTRNAVEALAGREKGDPGSDQIRLTGKREGSVTVIEISDTGPGLSSKARAHLFEAFQSSTRSGGTGLGLAIAAELVRAHGGEIRLIEGTIGATFCIAIPDRAVSLAERRSRA
jgi:signal transduction histidine kinase